MDLRENKLLYAINRLLRYSEVTFATLMEPNNGDEELPWTQHWVVLHTDEIAIVMGPLKWEGESGT